MRRQNEARRGRRRQGGAGGGRRKQEHARGGRRTQEEAGRRAAADERDERRTKIFRTILVAPPVECRQAQFHDMPAGLRDSGTMQHLLEPLCWFWPW